MKNTLFFTFLIFLLNINTIFSNNKTDEKRISELINKMTIEEKVGQLIQLVPSSKNIDEIKTSIFKGKTGSMCITKNFDVSPENLNALQKIAMEKTRLSIPLIFGYDVIHGFSTIFPSSLGLASSWDEKEVEEAQSIAAKEARNYGIHLTFSPMVDVSRDARWGRISESAGEDVLLNCRMGAASVRGFQGDDLKNHDNIGSCVKHFVGYGLSMGGRDKQFTEISKRTLLNTYLPPFKACVDAGAVSVMTSFNDISGVPATANHYTLTEILKDNWGFKGFTLSDWEAVSELKNHGIAGSDSQAAKLAIEAGTDVEMKTTTYESLIDLYKNGKVSKKTIDNAVRRVLRIKYKLGLFENPYVDVKKAYKTQFTESNKKIARKIAADCMVLLKNNNNILPINKIDTISLFGPYANNQDLLSHWVGFGKKDSVTTAEKGLKNNLPQGINIITGFKAVKNSSTAIVCLGEYGKRMGESGCVSYLSLPKEQIDLVKEAKKYYKKVIVVVFCGRPMVFTQIEDYADAILIAWHPGSEAGNALADILYGKVNPSAKTTCSYLKSTGQVPLFYSDRISGRPREDKYIDIDAKPLYPFGYGLSYTTFNYSNLKLSSTIMDIKNGKINVSVDIKNSGKMDGKEVVELYIHDKVASVTRPQKELKDFKKVFIKAGETKTVNFTIKPEMLSFYNLDLKKIIEPGSFDLWVGKNSRDLLHREFEVK